MILQSVSKQQTNKGKDKKKSDKRLFMIFERAANVDSTSTPHLSREVYE